MIFKLTNFSVILFITTLINFFTTTIAWQRRKTKGGVYFALGMLGITIWTFAASLDYAAIPIPLKVFFAKLEYTGYNSALSLLAIFSLFYVGHDELWKSKRTKAFFALPIISILLAWTNDIHGWLWSRFTRSELGDNTVIFEHGPGFVWAIIIGYLMVAVIVVNLWRASRQGSELSRRQARLLLFATFIPILSNLVYLSESEFTSGIDWSSLTFSISGVFFVLALYSTRFLDIVPIARRTVFEQMKDSVLLLDVNNNMVDFNLATKEFFNVEDNDLGKPIKIVMSDWLEFIRLFPTGFKDRLNATLDHDENSTIFDVHLTPLEDHRGQVYGKMLVFRDITEQHRAEHALGERVKELKCIYDLALLVETPDISLDEILQGSVYLIAVAMQYPELAWARLLLGERTYVTENYQETASKLSQDIVIAGGKVGSIEVGYQDDSEDERPLPFLKEEKKLLLIMAERLGNVIQNVQAEEALRDSEELLRTVSENYPNSFLSIIEKDFTIGLTAGQEFKNQNLNPNQFIGLHLEDVFGEKTDLVQQRYKETFGGEGQTFELFINDQYQLYRTVPLYSQDGSIQRILAVVENITERKLADQQLQQVQEQLMEQQRELAKNEERQRMARDLHDSVSQSIHSMVLFSETLAATLEKNNLERAGQIVERLQESARQSHKETRLLLYQLQAEGPERSVDLVRDLEERLAKVERHTGVKAQVVQEGSRKYIPLEWHKNLFWIAIEALNNALKHAQARNVQVLLRCSPEHLEMEIKDDGIGFETTKVGAGGLGLGNMHARADIIDGKLTIQSEPGQGTIVRFVAETNN